jgi:Sulfotransferase family
VPWTPPPRAPWVDRVIALGSNLGDDGRSLVPLDVATSLADATRVTGLDDFGDAWFREPLAVFVRALEEEAQLHLLGRLMARAEIQRVLQNRLRMEDLRRREPAIARERVEAPLVVTGLGRAGTTFLHELLAQDPANRVPMLWETMYSVPAPETVTYETDPRIAEAHLEASLMDEIVPAVATMQEIGGALPTECIYLFAHQFASDMWIGTYNIPSYTRWMVGSDPAPAYAYHRRMLELLQWRHRLDRWVLKGPSHLHNLPALFAEYPDARVVISHRDPLRVLGSLTNLMSTLHWMRSDHPHHEGVVKSMAFGAVFQLEKIMQERASGAVPDDRIFDVRYPQLVADPIATVRSVYARFGIPFTSVFEERLRARLAARPREARGAHEYNFADTGLDLASERARLARYQERYGVASEV